MKPEHVKRFAETEVNPAYYGHGTIEGPAETDLTDVEMIAQALNMWANWIESGDVNLSAKDAHDMGKKVRALGPEGMERVLRLRRLAEDQSNYESFKRGLTSAPMTYCPALLKAMVETCFAKRAFRPGHIHRFVKQVEDECELNLRTSQEHQKPDTASPTSRTTER